MGPACPDRDAKDRAPVANGKVATTPSGMRIDFDKGTACGTLLPRGG